MRMLALTGRNDHSIKLTLLAYVWYNNAVGDVAALQYHGPVFDHELG